MAHRVEQEIVPWKLQISSSDAVTDYSTSTNVDTESPVAVSIDEGVTLPDEMSLADVQDAVIRARRFVGQGFPLIVCLRAKVLSDGQESDGLAYFFNSGQPYIEASIEAANNASRSPAENGYIPGPPMQQLWTTIFEEAFHIARHFSGDCDFNSYYQLPDQYTEKEFQMYLKQPEEKLVDDVLNSGILKEKFGDSAVFFKKQVLHKRRRTLAELDLLPTRVLSESKGI